MALHIQPFEEVIKDFPLHSDTGRNGHLLGSIKFHLTRKTDQVRIRQRQPLNLRIETGLIHGFEVEARHQALHVPFLHGTVAVWRNAKTLLKHPGEGLL
ncbi:hypothetical protein D3C81_2075650 [compost metagenome]